MTVLEPNCTASLHLDLAGKFVLCLNFVSRTMCICLKLRKSGIVFIFLTEISKILKRIIGKEGLTFITHHISGHEQMRLVCGKASINDGGEQQEEFICHSIPSNFLSLVLRQLLLEQRRIKHFQ